MANFAGQNFHTGQKFAGYKQAHMSYTIATRKKLFKKSRQGGGGGEFAPPSPYRVKILIAINGKTSLNTDEYGALFSPYSVVFYSVIISIKRCTTKKRRNFHYVN